MVDVVKNCAWYVSKAKRALGDEFMTDRELGEHIGYSQQLINRAKQGNMSNPIAIAIAHAAKIDAGEVLLVAKISRSKDATLRDYIAKTFPSGEQRAA